MRRVETGGAPGAPGTRDWAGRSSGTPKRKNEKARYRCGVAAPGGMERRAASMFHS